MFSSTIFSIGQTFNFTPFAVQQSLESEVSKHSIDIIEPYCAEHIESLDWQFMLAINCSLSALKNFSICSVEVFHGILVSNNGTRIVNREAENEFAVR